MELSQIESSGGRKDLTVTIVSAGGSAYAAMAMYDDLREMQHKGWYITAKVKGYAASAAAMIVLQAANRRVASENARFLIHEVRQFKFGLERKSDSIDELREITALTDQICRIIAKRSGKSPEEVHKTFERKEVWFSAAEALEWGLIDEVT